MPEEARWNIFDGLPKAKRDELVRPYPIAGKEGIVDPFFGGMSLYFLDAAYGKGLFVNDDPLPPNLKPGEVAPSTEIKMWNQEVVNFLSENSRKVLLGLLHAKNEKIKNHAAKVYAAANEADLDKALALLIEETKSIPLHPASALTKELFRAIETVKAAHPGDIALHARLDQLKACLEQKRLPLLSWDPEGKKMEIWLRITEYGADQKARLLSQVKLTREAGSDDRALYRSSMLTAIKGEARKEAKEKKEFLKALGQAVAGRAKPAEEGPGKEALVPTKSEDAL